MTKGNKQKTIVTDNIIPEEKPIVSSTPEKKPIVSKKQVDKIPTIASHRFNEPITSSRPVNVYLEIIKGIKIIGYTTEDGKEIGRTAITKRDELTKTNHTVGYDYSISADIDTINDIKELSFPKTSFYIKDGTHRDLVDVDEFTV